MPAHSIGLTLLCAVSAAAAPTFTRDVAPILYKNCVICHRPGEIVPMSLLDYQSARPWANAQGDPKDLPARPTFAEGWRLGKPDPVIDIGQDFRVPAGKDLYKDFVVTWTETINVSSPSFSSSGAATDGV